MPKNPFFTCCGNLPGNRDVSRGRLGSSALRSLVFAALIPQLVQGQGHVGREFPVGALKRIDELPEGRFRADLDRLPPAAQGRALEWLRGFYFPASDAASLHVDPDGGICYACEFGHAHGAEETQEAPVAEGTDPETANAPVPVSPFPDSLKFSSRRV